MLLKSIMFLLAATACSKQNSNPPILILGTQNSFGLYTGEILKAEGFNEFNIDSLSSHTVDKSYLKQYDLIILAESKVSQAAKELLTEFMKKGGNLIAFRPDPSISELFGITPADGNVADGYITIDTCSNIGKSLTGKSIQFHGTADIFIVTGGKTIASLFSGKQATVKSPALVSNNYGKGHSMAFLYNLPESIVLTRQGNPLFAGIEKDSIPGLRGMDLFADGWLDNSNSIINQADEQMALFSHCIEEMSTYTKPLPRLWYFPDSLKCLVTLTNDGEYKSESDFEPQFQDVDSMGAKMSIYIIGVDNVSREWVDKWSAKGFEIAGHPDDTKEASDPRWNNMDSVIRAKKSEIADKYGLPSRTVVNHWFVWCGKDKDGKHDFAAQAKLEEINGIEMDINYAHYDINSNQGDNYLGPRGTDQGNFTGSGLPIKFADANGKLINVYQHLNAVYDQQYNESHDPDGFYHCFKGLMDRSLHNEVYSFISVKSHNDEYYFSKAPLMKMLAYANSNGIPVWTASKLLDFLKMRDEAKFSDIKWRGNILSFAFCSSLDHSNGITIMVPFEHNDMKAEELTLNGSPAEYSVRTVKGKQYAFLTVKPDLNHSITVKYSNLKL